MLILRTRHALCALATAWLVGCSQVPQSSPADPTPAPADPALADPALAEPAAETADVATPPSDSPIAKTETARMPQTEEEWKAKLTPEQYRVLRMEGTERAYTGKYLNHDEDGVYACAGCGTKLYDSSVKFVDGGWPNFMEAIPGAVATRDVGGGVMEVHCAKCEGHLGHIFNDGPGPTGKRH